MNIELLSTNLISPHTRCHKQRSRPRHQLFFIQQEHATVGGFPSPETDPRPFPRFSISSSTLIPLLRAPVALATYSSTPGASVVRRPRKMVARSGTSLIFHFVAYRYRGAAARRGAAPARRPAPGHRYSLQASIQGGRKGGERERARGPRKRRERKYRAAQRRGGAPGESHSALYYIERRGRDLRPEKQGQTFRAS